MPYGIIKVDTVTFTDNGVDKNISLSGLVQNPTFTGNVTATGTISGDIIRGGTTVSGATVTGTTANFASGVFTTQLSGTTITGTTVATTTGTFTSLTGTTTTGITANFTSGVFTTQLSGVTITAPTGTFTSLTGTTTTGTTANFVSGVFTTQLSGVTITGTTVTATTGTFTSLTGTTTTGITANFASGVFTTQISGAIVVATTIELGNASDTTLSRSAAGVLAVEGVVIPSISSTSTLTNKTLTDPAIIGTILEDVFTITDGAAFEVDPGNGSIQLITLGDSRTPKCTNFVAGESVTLMVNDGTAYTITWTDATWGTGGVIWKGGTAPTLATTGFSVIQFWKVSTQVYGASVGDVA